MLKTINGMSAGVGAGAACMVVAAASLSSFAYMVARQQAIKEADVLIDAETKNSDGVVVDVEHIAWCIAVFGAAGVVAGICGVVGAATHKRAPLSIYSLGSLAFAVFSALAALALTTLLESVEPTLRRDVAEFCAPNEL